MRKQQVHFGKTISGRIGFFTGTVLALGIDDKKQLEAFRKDPTLAREYANKIDFELTQTDEEVTKTLARLLKLKD